MFKPTVQLPVKKHKNRNLKKAKNTMSQNHNYAVLSTSYALVTYKQLEAFRRYIYRRLKKKSPKTVRVHINYSLFKKASKSRMGKGKGKFFKWFGYIRPGMILFEFSVMFVKKKKIFEMFTLINSKIPFSSRIIYKNFVISTTKFFNAKRKS